MVWTFIILAAIAIWLGIGLYEALMEELTQDIYTVTHEHARYYTRLRGTNKFWLQDLNSLVLLVIFAAVVFRFAPFKEMFGGVVLAVVYLILAAFGFCLLFTGWFWRGYAVRELRNLEAHAE